MKDLHDQQIITTSQLKNFIGNITSEVTADPEKTDPVKQFVKEITSDKKPKKKEKKKDKKKKK